MRAWWWVGALALAVVLTTTERFRSTPPADAPVAQSESPAAPPEGRTFEGEGRSVTIQTPILDSVAVSDALTLCEVVREALDAARAADRDMGLEVSCAGISVTEGEARADRLTRLAAVASQLNFANIAAEPDGGEMARLTLSALRAALDAVPATDPTRAEDALALAAYPPRGAEAILTYEPAFLRRDAMTVEVATARAALCEVRDPDRCLTHVEAGAVSAMIQVGRWHADIPLLMRAARAMERLYPSLVTLEDVTPAAGEYLSAYGYAGEIATGDDKLRYFRKGLRPLEAWYEAQTAEKRPLISDTLLKLGAQYGRIADASGDAADARKAVRYDTLAYEEALSRGHRSWARLANLGNSTLRLAEVEGDADGVEKALSMHREAHALTTATDDDERRWLMEAKLARTLLWTVYLGDHGDEETIARLTEAVERGRAVLPHFEATGAAQFRRITANVVENAQARLDQLGASSAGQHGEPRRSQP